MSNVKKDHSIGAGTGAGAGALAGAGVGAAVGGPAGAAVGAVIGAVAGAKAGDSLAEVVNPTEYSNYWKSNYTTRPYYSDAYSWSDYDPAYKYGYDAYGQYRGKTFDTVESDLERNWNTAKGNSRLAWNDAKHAVKEGWHHVERAIPGDFDRDGR